MEILPHELSDCSRWLLQRAELVVPAYCIAVDIHCPACQPSVAHPLADYLNEFGDLPSLSWKAFDAQLLRRLESSPLANQLKTEHEDLALTLAKLGGSIIEGPRVSSRAATHQPTFQVCLACNQPESVPFHLHLNQKRFEPNRVVAIIADSFLEWVDGGGDPPSAKDAHPHASHAL